MKVDAKTILCKKCLTDALFPDGEMISHIEEYVASLPPEVRVSNEIYEARLHACASCEHLVNLTCRLCGCFVQARCAKKKQNCPIPGNPKWIQETEESESN